MPDVKANEREFSNKVATWMVQACERRGYPFEISAETSIKLDDTTRFPDVVVWLNRRTALGFCVIACKTPVTDVRDAETLLWAAKQAQQIDANYFGTWNMRETVLWRTPAGLITAITEADKAKEYLPLPQITSPEDLFTEPGRTVLQDRASEILDDLDLYRREGHVHQFETDTTFFVDRLKRAVEQLAPPLHRSLEQRRQKEADFRKKLAGWATKQGIANYADPEFYETVSRQIAYRILGRILFYQTLRRFTPSLPKMDLAALSGRQVSEALGDYFGRARAVDYQAIFEFDLTDEIWLSDQAATVLVALVHDLDRFNFSSMPIDVVGAVFERLIPPEERHALGQYFTQERLVDLIVAFCVRTRNDVVLDPTCGSGTFLVRAYDRLKFLGERNHRMLLERLWGVDIAQFPAELATINLYRFDLSDYANFPRIHRGDFFEVFPGHELKFPPQRQPMTSPIGSQ